MTNEQLIEKILKESDLYSVPDSATIAIIAHICNVAIGEASMCWDNVSGAGNYNSELAMKISLELIDKIIIEMKRVRVGSLKEYIQMGTEDCKKITNIISKN